METNISNLTPKTILRASRRALKLPTHLPFPPPNLDFYGTFFFSSSKPRLQAICPKCRTVLN